MTKVPDPQDFGIAVKPYFYEGKRGFAPGTFWTWWGGLITAAHVITEQEGNAPYFSKGDIQTGEGIIDAALIGCDLAGVPRPREPKEKERLFVYGWPNASGYMTERISTAYLKRGTPSEGYHVSSWIGEIDELPSPVLAFDGPIGVRYQPVGKGMSGGLILAEDGPIGILTALTSPFDIDRDGDLDQFYDFTALSDVWDFFKSTDNLIV